MSTDWFPLFLDLVLRASWQATVLIGLVLLLQRLLRRWLSPPWRYALWLVVVARLLLPVVPASAWSVFNLVPALGSPQGLNRPSPTTLPTVPTAAAANAANAAATLSPRAEAAPTPWPLRGMEPIPAPSAPAGSAERALGPLDPPLTLLAPAVGGGERPALLEPADVPVPVVSRGGTWLWVMVWALGAAVLGTRVLWTTLRFRSARRRCARLADVAVDRLLDECRERLGIRRDLDILEADWVRAPALCGWWRPCLLVPTGLARSLSPQELRHVLLHELAHLRRGDILVNWAATAAQVLHWFNPVVWWAWRRLRADRELAADHLALAALGEGQAQCYGQTILKLLDRFAGPVAVPAVVGILEDRRAMRERMAAIAAFRQPSRWSVGAVLVVAGLGLVTLTDAAPRQVAAAGEAVSSATEAGSEATAAGLARYRLVDLTPHYVTRWETIRPGTSWSAVPKGRQTFEGVPFELGGLLELSGLGALRDNKQFPTRVEGLGVGGLVGVVHLLHGAAYDAPDGTAMGKVVLHYADGATAELLLRYGVHARNWWVETSERSGAISDPGSRVAWTGTSPETDAWGVTLRLFHTRFANPRPDQPVTHLDVVSLLARATPVILGLTVEAPGLEAPALAAVAPSNGAAADGITPPGQCRLRVLAADSGAPIPGASVRLQVADARTAHAFGDHRADPEGWVTVDYPTEGITQFTLVARGPGYLPRREVVKGGPLPAELTLKLDPGIRIGGVVQDPGGRPVPGVQVQLNGVMRDAVGQVLEEELDRVLTDAAGRWTSRNAPSSPEDLNFKLTHPEFFAVEYDQAASPGERLVTIESLRAGQAVMTLEPGLEITGTVRDPEGRGVAEAAIVLASGEEFEVRREARTDATGRFRLVVLEPGEAAVLAQARGWAPVQQKVDLEADLEPLSLVLEAGRRIRGQVVSEPPGPPVAGARVRLERWRQPELLTWSAVTDADGRFEWDDAPRDLLMLAVSKEGFGQGTRAVSAAEGGEGDLVKLGLARAFRLTGRVLDADTGQPITPFRLVQGHLWGGLAEDETYWEPGRERSFLHPDGEYSVGSTYESGPQVRFLAVADGYLPEASPAFEPTGWQEHTFRLRRGEGPKGGVVNAAGQPVAGAEVAVVGFGYLSLGADGFRPAGSGRSLHLTRSDADGRFALPALLPNAHLVAVHPEAGFAEVTQAELATAGRVVLQPWGRIEGVMRFGAKVAPDQEVCVVNASTGPGGWHLDFEEFRTRTDAAGGFRFERVPPGPRELMRPIPMGDRAWSWSHRQRITVAPGEITRVTYGGLGRPVIGRVVLSDPTRKVTWRNGHHLLSTRFPPPPLDRRSTSEDLRAWRQSAEFREYQAQQRSYAPTWEEDGSFRFEDVLPGRYDLRLSFTEDASGMGGASVGGVHREIEVPEIPGGQTDEPLDLGELTLELRSEQTLAAERQRQAEGTRAASGSDPLVDTLGGASFDFRQMEGKQVLMTAWSATNANVRAELASLKRLHDEYAADSRLLMLGLVMDDQLEPARQLVAELGIAWVQLITPPDMRAELPRQFPGAELPLSLFGRPGQVPPPTPLRGEAVRAAVREALGAPVPSASSAPARDAPSAAATATTLIRDTAPPELRDSNPRF